MSRPVAGRFLHVNLNGKSADATGAFYSAILGLQSRMQTDPSVPTDGSMFGFDGPIHSDTRFYYDVRGGRGGCALEAIEWFSPALLPDTRPGPGRPGIRAAWFAVADLDGTAAALRDAGAIVGSQVHGLISGEPAVLAIDPDGVVVELTQATAASAPLFCGILLSVSDAAAAVHFLTTIGFEVKESPEDKVVSADRLTPGGDSTPVNCRMARVVLPEDGGQFSVRLIEHPDAAGQRAPAGANSQGLYRCALRVDDVNAALAALPDSVEVTAGPVYCPLPGTKIGGLNIAFLASPDGVVFEFVERPLSYFQR
ncbi:MAG: Glyoxalase/bleomycin resistance protein/dioxygenase [Mycobacterium sp.]|nr:Glyoxalase/bleomycin resistance protein/dioxygenase [Mycobacterium sp.]